MDGRTVVTAGFGVTVLGLSGVTPVMAASDSPHATRGGHAILDRKLTGVTAISPEDAWSVGYVQPDVYHARTLIRHWNGSGWTDTAHPEPGGFDYLYDVDAVSGQDVWAVGETAVPRKQASRTLVEHWDGSTWSIVPSANPSDAFNDLSTVSADSATDVWAAGQSGQDQGPYDDAGLMEHWDGQSWSTVTLPVQVWWVSSIDALSPSDVWATGVTVVHKVSAAVVLHWDGSAWSIGYSHDSVRHNGYGVSGVVALSSDDVWAVGVHNYRHGRGKPPVVPFALHWDGSSWTSTRTPRLTDDTEFASVDASSSDDVWAVGTTGQCTCAAPVIEHWNGSRWTVADVPTVDAPTSLKDIHSTSATDAWAVGGGRSQLLTLHWNGSLWRKST